MDGHALPQHVEVAYLVLIRHGEKYLGNGLSEDGKRRVHYLSKCINKPHASLALPLGPPTHVMASHGAIGKSYRPQATAAPIAAALGLELDDDFHFKDTEGFAGRVEEVLCHGGTVLAAWHHGEIPSLVRALLKEDQRKAEVLGWQDAWPHQCGTEAFVTNELPGSTCYDLMWRLSFTRHKNATVARGEPWKVTALSTTLEGFSGDPDGHCFEGLASRFGFD